MIINQVQLNKPNHQFVTPKQNEVDPSFTGLDATTLVQFLRFLDTNPAWGTNLVDLGFMVTPRVIVDTARNPDAGLETFRREIMGTTNHASVGAYGLAAGAVLALPILSKFGVNSNKIFADNDTISMMAKDFDDVLKLKPKASNAELMDDYLSRVIDKFAGFNPASEKATAKGYVDIVENKAQIIEKLKGEILKPKESINKKDWKEVKRYISSLITSETGAESKFRFSNKRFVTNEADIKRSYTSINNFLNDIVNVSRSFLADKVKGEFSAKTLENNVFLKMLKSTNLKRAAAGIAIASAIGMSTQPLNIYLTKKKTGSDGFVGVEGRKKDKSLEFKAMKVGVAGVFAALIKKCLNCSFKDIPKKIQFKGFTPTVEQLMVVYGLTIISRFMAARDKDELRECAVKDFLGYTNLLVLGSAVAKLTGKLLDKDLLNVDPLKKGLFNASLKTRDEVLHEGLKRLEPTFSPIKDGKALTFRELIEKAKSTPGGRDIMRKIIKLNIAQCAGFAYAGLVVGFGVPKLNIWMTNYLDKKKKAKKQNLIYNHENMMFLKERTNRVSFSGITNK